MRFLFWVCVPGFCWEAGDARHFGNSNRQSHVWKHISDGGFQADLAAATAEAVATAMGGQELTV